MRIYVAGKITGVPLNNAPAFAAETARLRQYGHEVVNPIEVNAGFEHQGWLACMKRDLAELVTCDSVVMLEGWERSRGATIEHDLATKLGMLVFYPASTLLQAA